MLVDPPGRPGGVLPGPGRRRRGRAPRRLGRRDQRLRGLPPARTSPGRPGPRSAPGPRRRRPACRRPAPRRRAGRSPRPRRGPRARARRCRWRRGRSSETCPVRITSGSSCAHGRVGPTSTSGSSRGRGGELGDVLARIGMLQASDPEQVALRKAEARPRPRRSAAASAGTSTTSGASGMTTTRSGSSPRRAKASSRERLGGHDHAHGALHRQLAQAGARACAQVLAAALQRGEVVKRDHHRARAVQQRSVHPGRVEHVGVAGPVGLDESPRPARPFRAAPAAGSASSARPRAGR